MKAFRKVGFRTHQPEEGGQGFFSIKAEEAREALILNLDFQPRKHPVKKDFAVLGSQTTGLPAFGLASLQP